MNFPASEREKEMVMSNENGPLQSWDHLNELAKEIDALRRRELNTLVARFFADNPSMKAEDAVLVEDRQGSVTRWYMERRTKE